MLFPTIDFALFFAVVLPASWLLAPRPLRWKLFLLLASYVFYGWWDWRFVWLLLASTLINQMAASVMAKHPSERVRRGILVAAVAANLGILGYFKYFGFFVTSAANVLDTVGLEPNVPLLRAILPVGISFFTFQALSYVIDTYRRQLQPAALLDFAVYLSFFPQLVAGPIVRAREFLPQLRARRDPRRVDGGRAFALIVSGLFKKVVIANFVATSLVDQVFANPTAYSSLEILFAVYGYAVQIYADFSGYTDIAIGLALLLGFRFPENFDAPYAARSLRDFWRRWHITLSTWLRDYLYVPLGGSRGGPRRTTRNILLTMLLGGLWHGAAWTFVVWGALHGLGLAWERTHNIAVVPGDTDARAAVRAWLRTFHLVCLAWIFFRADSLAIAGTMLWRLLTAWGPAPALSPAIVLVIAGTIAFQLVPRGLGERVQVVLSRMAPVPLGVTLGASLLVIDALGPEGVDPFIYFQF